MSSLQQNQRTRGRNRFCPEVGVGRGVAQIMYTHVSKCKNDKIKSRKECNQRKTNQRKIDACLMGLTDQVPFH
jgi:hypothetical protein